MPKKQVSDETWEEHKDTIISHFVEDGMSLTDLVKIMGKHGLHASSGQLQRQLKHWEIPKNISKEQWRAITNEITVRKARFQSSAVWLKDRRIPPKRVQKAIQRYGLPTRLPSAPTSSLMDGIRVSTPPPTHGSYYHRTVSIEGLPFREFECKSDELFRLTSPITSRLISLPYIERLLPAVAQQLMNADLVPSSLRKQPRCETWESVLERMSHFPIPLSKPNEASATGVYLWLVKFIIIGSTNGLLRDYEDATLEWLIESVSITEVMDAFLGFVVEFDLCVIVERILDLGTTTTDLFASHLLLSCIHLENDQVLDMLLSRGVSLDSFRNDHQTHWPLCALHLAVERQSETVIRRLLSAGIDPDGYIEKEDLSSVKPLSWLLHLHQRRDETRVIRISNTTVKLILDARRTSYARDLKSISVRYISEPGWQTRRIALTFYINIAGMSW